MRLGHKNPEHAGPALPELEQDESVADSFPVSLLPYFTFAKSYFYIS